MEMFKSLSTHTGDQRQHFICLSQSFPQDEAWWPAAVAGASRHWFPLPLPPVPPKLPAVICLLASGCSEGNLSKTGASLKMWAENWRMKEATWWRAGRGSSQWKGPEARENCSAQGLEWRPGRSTVGSPVEGRYRSTRVEKGRVDAVCTNVVRRLWLRHVSCEQKDQRQVEECWPVVKPGSKNKLCKIFTHSASFGWMHKIKQILQSCLSLY